jgi:hypothetical protein
MWKSKHPEVPNAPTPTERNLDQRDKTIRGMIDELVRGAEELKNNTRQLRTTYTGEDIDHPKPA